jgi:WhiB family redox-sensing transcriptional regulator
MFNIRPSDWEWLDKASCKDIENPDIFFPPRDKELYRLQADEAKTYCYGGNGMSACPVRQRCLWQAIEQDKQHGIWGGMSHRERNAFVRKWQRQYKHQMTLKEYIFQEKEKENGSN